MRIDLLDSFVGKTDDRLLDRAHLQPSPPPTRTRQTHPRRVRASLRTSGHPDSSVISHNHCQLNLQQSRVFRF